MKSQNDRKQMIQKQEERQKGVGEGRRVKGGGGWNKKKKRKEKKQQRETNKQTNSNRKQGHTKQYNRSADNEKQSI